MNIKKSVSVYVPWEFFAVVFGLVAVCFVAVSFALLSPDDLRFYELARFSAFAALPFAVLSMLCVYMFDKEDKV